MQGSSVVERGPVTSAFNLIPFIEKDLGGFLLFKGHFVPFCFYFGLSSVFSLTRIFERADDAKGVLCSLLDVIGRTSYLGWEME